MAVIQKPTAILMENTTLNVLFEMPLAVKHTQSLVPRRVDKKNLAV